MSMYDFPLLVYEKCLADLNGLDIQCSQGFFDLFGADSYIVSNNIAAYVLDNYKEFVGESDPAFPYIRVSHAVFDEIVEIHTCYDPSTNRMTVYLAAELPTEPFDWEDA